MIYQRLLLFCFVFFLTSNVYSFQFYWFGNLAGTDASDIGNPPEESDWSYDYTPSWMGDTTVGYDRKWWCGYNPGAGKGKGKGVRPGDGIWYIDRKNPDPQVVLYPTEYWEGDFVCDPSVVRGQFKPPMMNKTYSMAMYYTATRSADKGRNNHIGVAFSTDGIHWDKYPGNPIIGPDNYNLELYGSGQQQVRNGNGKSNIQMWYMDYSYGENKQKLYEVRSIDGVNFRQHDELSKRGLPPYISNGGPGIALSPEAPYYLYGMFGRGTTPATQGTKLVLYKIPYNQRFTGVWESVDSVISGDLQMERIFEAGFRTDIFGNISRQNWPEIWIGFGCGFGNYPPEKSDLKTWNLCQAGGR